MCVSVHIWTIQLGNTPTAPERTTSASPCVISLRGRAARGPFPPDNTGGERAENDHTELCGTDLVVSRTIRVKNAELAPGKPPPRFSPTEVALWLAPSELRGRKIIPLRALRGNRKCPSAERESRGRNGAHHYPRENGLSR